MLNLKNFAVAATSFLHFKDSAEELMFGDDGKPVGATLFGPGSAEYAAAEKVINDRQIARVMKTGGKQNITAEQTLADQVDKLVACTQSFTPNLTYREDESAPALEGPALFKAVYSDREIGFIRDQAKSHMENWANFPRRSATS